LSVGRIGDAGSRWGQMGNEVKQEAKLSLG